MQYTKYLRWAIFALIGLVFVVPFIIADGKLVPDMFFPFITGKNFFFRILVDLMAGFYVFLALAEPRYRPRASLLMWAFLGFVAWMGLATILSVDPLKSLWSNFERMEGYIGLLHLYVFCVILGAVVDTERSWERFFQISVGASALQGIISFMQIAHLFGFAPSSQSGARADGTFGNATYLAVYMLFNIFLTLFLLVRTRRQTTPTVLYGIALALQATALFYTQTRGSLLGLIVGLIIAAIWIIWRAKGGEWVTLRKISIGALVSIAVVVLGFLVVRNSSFIQSSPTLQRFASISLTDRTTQSRLIIWRSMVLPGVIEKPLQGWGQENFNYVFNKYYVPQMYDQEQWFDRTHNAFLDWLIAGGIPAFLLYVSLFVLTCVSIIRSRLSVPEQAVLLGGLLAYVVNNLVVFDNLVSYIYFVLLIAYAHGLYQKKPHAMLAMSKPLSNEALAIAAPVVLIATVLGLWVINVPGIARARSLLTAVTPYTTVQSAQGTQQIAKDPKVVLAEFNAAFQNLPWPGTPLGWQETVEQMLQYASNTVAPSTSIAPDVKQQIYTSAHDNALALLQERQHDTRLELFMGTFLGTFGQNAEAQKYLMQALADSPKKQQVLFQLGITQLSASDTQGTLQYFKQAFDESPAYNEARIFYVVGLYYAGQPQEADRLLTEGFGTVNVDNPQLIQFYVQRKMYDRIIAIYQQRVAATPNDAQAHINLASAYFGAGDKANTIAELQRAAQLNSALAVQIQSLITGIQNGTIKP